MYFKSLIQFLNNNHQKMGVIAVFIWPFKICSMRMFIDDIPREHLEHFGWQHAKTCIDKIVARTSKFLANPATVLEDKRIPALLFK